MKPIVLFHGYSSESPTSDPASIENIYDLPRRLRASYDVVEVDLSRYVSLNDSVSVADTALGLNRALLEAVPTFSILRSRSRRSSRPPWHDPLVTYLPLRIPLNRRQLTSLVQPTARPSSTHSAASACTGGFISSLNFSASAASG